MKKRSAISLLSSISILMTTQSVEASREALSPHLAPTGASTARVTPSTLSELETFLRKNCGADFPEIGFSAFSTPFKPDFPRLTRIDQMRARTAAIEAIGQMIAVGYFSFDQEVQNFKKKVPLYRDIAAPRPTTMEYYPETTIRFF